MGQRKIDRAEARPQPDACGSQHSGTECLASEDQPRPADGPGETPEAAAPAGRDLNDNHVFPGAERLGFFGVILRAVERGSLRRYEIVIGHREDGRSKLFAAYDDDEHLVADWRSLGAELHLPLYILNAEGQLECATIEPAANMRQRRSGSPLSGRRPRFLMRRRPGQPSLMGIVHPVVMLGRHGH